MSFMLGIRREDKNKWERRVPLTPQHLKELKEKGIRLVDEKPRKGAGGAKIAFLHPKSTNGVLVELCER